MSNDRHHHHIEHKSVTAYVIGFILSLIFTLIPYYLVVNHTLKGMDLLLTIMGFAVVQLIVQIVFFLHIGRGPKPNWNLWFFAGTVFAILVVTGGSVIIMSNLHRKLPSSDQARQLIDSEGIYQVGGEMTGACQMTKENHVITLKDRKIEPALIVAEECDTLTFVDKDSVKHDIIFGSKKKSMTYAGMERLSVRSNHAKTITLSETGTFQYYDASQPKAAGIFTVNDD